MHFKLQNDTDVETDSSSHPVFPVPGTSYILRVSSLSAFASVGLVALVILIGYSFTWYGR